MHEYPQKLSQTGAHFVFNKKEKTENFGGVRFRHVVRV